MEPGRETSRARLYRRGAAARHSWRAGGGQAGTGEVAATGPGGWEGRGDPGQGMETSTEQEEAGLSTHTHTSACGNNKAGGKGAAPTPRHPAGDLRAEPTPTAARWHVWALRVLHVCSWPRHRPEQVPELTSRS